MAAGLGRGGGPGVLARLNGGVTQCGCAQVSVTKELLARGVSESRIVWACGRALADVALADGRRPLGSRSRAASTLHLGSLSGPHRRRRRRRVDVVTAAAGRGASSVMTALRKPAVRSVAPPGGGDRRALPTSPVGRGQPALRHHRGSFLHRSRPRKGAGEPRCEDGLRHLAPVALQPQPRSRQLQPCARLVPPTCAANVRPLRRLNAAVHRELYAEIIATLRDAAQRCDAGGDLRHTAARAGRQRRRAAKIPASGRGGDERAGVLVCASEHARDCLDRRPRPAAAGSLAAVLQQAVVPTTLIVTIFLLVGRRYSPLHWASAPTVVAGVAASSPPGRRFRKFRACRRRSSPRDCRKRSPTCGPRPRSRRRSLPCDRSCGACCAAGFLDRALRLGFNVLSGLLLTVARGEPPARVGRLPDRRALPRAQRRLRRRAGRGTRLRICIGALFTVSEFAVVQQASASAYMLLVALQLPLVAVALSASNPSWAARRAHSGRRC